ncbi:hypothetical protein SAMN05421786_108208 [Chryseobacterium ureilyticum]|uniref:Uncharacterized protein n=1 Tax=Chryseobacterium ureilyticum TaxID=373668 RepID=A0A1N7QBC9_9FLAO|nr:hypothetical protein [Chryseobacterium ureilyticum]SIT20165.1 hypothetical protein SAMN05421786_108208 [Chryseobacterium ureilyticum]
MKPFKICCSAIFLSAGYIVYGQIGINTPTPQTTLDVVAKNATGNSTSPDGLLVPRIDRQRAQVMTGTAVSTLVYVNNIATGTQGGAAVNIDTVGYYYYNGSVWVKLHNPSNTSSVTNNIYTADGALTGNRVVTQGTNTLAFTGTSVNAFSVDGTTLSADAANHRIGIGTSTPAVTLNVLPVTNEASIDVIAAGARNCGIPCGNPEIRNITMYNDQQWATQFATLDFIPGLTATSPSGAAIRGIDRDINNNYAGLQFYTRNATDYAPRLTVKSSGNVGIGTTTPNVKLHTVGTAPYTAFQLQDGNEGINKVLASDNTGRATWVTSSSTIATVLGTMNTTVKPVAANTLIGSSLTLPAGRWLVYIGQLLYSSSAANAANNSWVRITLSSSNTVLANTTFSFLASNLVAGWLSPSAASGTGYSFLTGVIPIQVNTPTTIYSWFRAIDSTGTPPGANVGNNGENYLFASPMN